MSEFEFALLMMELTTLMGEDCYKRCEGTLKQITDGVKGLYKENGDVNGIE